jgi:hypothetical protein
MQRVTALTGAGFIAGEEQSRRGLEVVGLLTMNVK